MKALSIKQPYASLIAQGFKTIETRTWSTPYRGPILICASKAVDQKAMVGVARKMGPGLCLTGAALAIADLVDCRPMTGADEYQACCSVYQGAYAWVLTNVRPIKPFPVRGQLGLFEVEVKSDT